MTMNHGLHQDESRVYWSNIEFTYQEGAAQHGIFEGGVVYAFARAFDVREAISLIEKEFDMRDLGIRSFDFVTEYGDIPWGTEDDQLHFDGVAALAGSTGEVFLDSFEVYERR